MQTIGFDKRNAALGLGSATIYIFVYFAQVIIVILFVIIILSTGERFVRLRHVYKIKKGLFFNSLITLTLECQIEFLIYSFLNFYTKDFSMNGETLGFFIAVFCSFCMIFVFIALLWAISTKNQRQIANRKFLKRWGALFEFINIKNRIALLYNIIYLSRRFIYVILCFKKNESEGLIIVIYLMVNLLLGTIIVGLKAFKEKKLNQQDFLGEIVVAFAMYWNILYTSAVTNQELK